MLQLGGILKYVENLKRGTNVEIGLKYNFNILSNKIVSMFVKQ